MTMYFFYRLPLLTFYFWAFYSLPNSGKVLRRMWIYTLDAEKRKYLHESCYVTSFFFRWKVQFYIIIPKKKQKKKTNFHSAGKLAWLSVL